jgi:hypothetical protein
MTRTTKFMERLNVTSEGRKHTHSNPTRFQCTGHVRHTKQYSPSLINHFINIQSIIYVGLEPGQTSRYSDRLHDRGSIFGRGNRFFSWLQRPGRLWGPPIQWIMRALSLGVKRQGREAYPSTLKMETICSSETSVYCQRTTRRYISVDATVHNRRCENLKSYIMIFMITEI